MRLADYVIATFEAAGVDHVFTVCGGGSIFLNDALAKAKKLKYVACHHEQAAAMAAEGYARVRTGLGCAIVTSGPGGTNAITGVAGAWLDHVPTITISGQVFSSQMGARPGGLRTLGVQEINIIDLVRPITKYAVTVTGPESIRFHLEKAIYTARHGRPGPVWLDIPADVQNAQIDPDMLSGFEPPPKAEFFGPFWTDAFADPEQVADVLELLSRAKRPLIHIGQGVRIARAESELFAFLRRTNIPVVTARNGADLIDSSDPLYVGRPGTFAQRGANFAVQTCDVLLAIGTRLSLAQTGYNAKDYARNARVVMVDIDRAELDKGTVPLHMKVHADAKSFLYNAISTLASYTKSLPDWSDWLARCKAWQETYPPVTDAQRQQGQFVNSYHLIDELSNQLTADDIIVTDMGFAFQTCHQAFRIKAGQRLMTNCGLAAMGWGLPAAIGAALGSNRRVVLIVGDGGLMMNLQELATLSHHKLNIKIFLLNNGGYLTMRQSQAHAFMGQSPGTPLRGDGYMGSDEKSGLSFPHFRDIATSFGIAESRASVAQAIGGDVRAALAHDGPFLLEVMMDPDQACAPKSINRREADGSIKQTAIEDAWPYLSPDELAANLQI